MSNDNKPMTDDRKLVIFLWGLLDNIDTLDDACKCNDSAFRSLARKQQLRRWESGITSDGYNLFFPEKYPNAIIEIGKVANENP